MKTKYLFRHLTSDRYSQQAPLVRSWYVFFGGAFNVIYYFLFDRTHEENDWLREQMFSARMTVFVSLSMIALAINVKQLRKHAQWVIFPAGTTVGLAVLYLMQLGAPSDAYHNTYLPELILVLCLAPLVAELTPFISGLQMFVFVIVYNAFVGPKLSQENRHWMINVNLLMTICIFYVILLRTYLQRLTASHKRSKILIEKEKLRLSKKNTELLDLDALKSKILSVLTHDVRAPLANILGLLETKKYVKRSESDTALDDIIEESTKQTLQLLNNLLEWSTTQMKGIQINIAPISLYKLVDDVIRLFQSSADVKGLFLRMQIPRNLTIQSDPSILQLLLRNLISNAIKFTGSGFVTVGCNKLHDGIEIFVSDTGTGIPADAKIFDSGQIRSAVGTNNEKGSGFGLLLCKEYLNRLDGNLYYETKETGGTTFFIYLPVVPLMKTVKEFPTPLFQ